MEDNSMLCLNLRKVRKGMRQKRLTQKELANAIGIKDPHTIAYYFKNPEKIRLIHVTAIAEALGSTAYQYDEYVVRVRNAEEYQKLIKGDD